VPLGEASRPPPALKSRRLKDMRIDIWSDVVCPWCYVGKRNVEAALAELGLEPEIHWRAFELDPRSPKETSKNMAEALASKFGVSIDEATKMNEQMTGVAANAGLSYRLDIAKPSNSFDAHRLAKMAEAHGLGGEAAERLFSAYFTEGVRISDDEALVKLGTEIGLDAEAVRSMLASDEYADAVRSDEAIAHEAGFTGVPTIVVDERFAIPGAQPPETLVRLFGKIAEEEERSI
jgi:predicted DsbA family dithiol-disulfide isomerase